MALCVKVCETLDESTISTPPTGPHMHTNHITYDAQYIDLNKESSFI